MARPIENVYDENGIVIKYEFYPTSKSNVNSFFNNNNHLNKDDYALVKAGDNGKGTKLFTCFHKSKLDGTEELEEFPKKRVRKTINPKYGKFKATKYKTKERKCTYCKVTFITEVDEQGISFDTRCPKCKKNEKQNNDSERGYFACRVDKGACI